MFRVSDPYHPSKLPQMKIQRSEAACYTHSQPVLSPNLTCSADLRFEVELLKIGNVEAVIPEEGGCCLVL